MNNPPNQSGLMQHEDTIDDIMKSSQIKINKRLVPLGYGYTWSSHHQLRGTYVCFCSNQSIRRYSHPINKQLIQFPLTHYIFLFWYFHIYFQLEFSSTVQFKCYKMVLSIKVKTLESNVYDFDVDENVINIIFYFIHLPHLCWSV